MNEASRLCRIETGGRGQQLFFAQMRRALARQGRRPSKPPLESRPPVTARDPARGWRQMPLCVHPRDLRRRTWDAHAEELAWARSGADALAGPRGWNRYIVVDVKQALGVVLAHRRPGEMVLHSEIAPILSGRGLTVRRTVELLEHLDLLADDRVPAVVRWVEEVTSGFESGLRDPVRAWAMTLLEGGERTRPRQEGTVRRYLARLLPVLTAWSATIGHLREVTRGDIDEAVAGYHGQKAETLLTALRSLFRHCRRTRTIFTDPTRGIRRTRSPWTLKVPLPQQATSTVIRTVQASGSPRAAVVVALAAIHAARLKAIRHIQMDDIDFASRRLVIDGHSRPLDELTERAVRAWLAYRREHWPHSPNRHLLISKHTAAEASPMSHFALEEILRGSGVSLEQLRINRTLEEALAHGGDPLHLMAVFGMSDTAAIQYATNARALLHEPTADMGHHDTHRIHG